MSTVRGIARVTTWAELAAEDPDRIVAADMGTTPEPMTLVGGRGESAPGAVLRLTDVLCGHFGIIVGDRLLVEDAHYAPESWAGEPWLPFVPDGDSSFRYDLEVGATIEGPVLYVDTLNGRRNFGHFVHDTLPYAYLQRQLLARGVRTRALVAPWDFPSQERLASRLFLDTVRRDDLWVRVPELYLPLRQFCMSSLNHRVPVAAYGYLSRALPELVGVQTAAPSGPPVYLARPWGRYGEASNEAGRSYSNGPEVDAMLRREGFESIDTTTAPVDDVLARVASAPLVVSLHGAQCGHILWANSSAIFVELTGPRGNFQGYEALAECAGIRKVEARARQDEQGVSMDLDVLSEALEAARAATR